MQNHDKLAWRCEACATIAMNAPDKPEPEESLVARLREESDAMLKIGLISDLHPARLLREAADALERAEKEQHEARSNALDAVASYILTYGGMSGGPKSWADLADAIREDRFGPTDEQARIMHQVLTGGTF